MDVERLIAVVKKRRPLWDMEDRKYSDRNINSKLWGDIEKLIGFPRHDIKKKWKSLRDTYRVELKKEAQALKSGATASSRKKWVYSEQMSFLKDIMTPAPLSESLATPTPLSDGHQTLSEVSPKMDFSFDFSNCEENTYSAAEATRKENKTTTTSDTAKGSKKRNADDLYLELEREKIAILKKNSETKMDGDYNFLISFLPVMKEMTQIQKLEFRAEMSNLALNIIRRPKSETHQ